MPSVGPTLDLLLLIPVLVIGGLVVAALIGDRRRRGRGSDAARWAINALYLVRAGLGVGALAALAIAVFPTADSSLDGIARTNGMFAISVVTSNPSALCAKHHIRLANGHLVPGAECAASRATILATPKNARFQGVVLTVQVPAPTSGETRRYELLRFARALGWLLGLLAVERIVTNAATGRRFARGNVLWLRVLAVMVVFVGWIVPGRIEWFTNGLVARYGDLDNAHERLRDSQLLGHSPFLSLLPFGVAILLLVLSEIWRYGIRLQADVDATV